MRFPVDAGKAYLFGCLALTWTLTACASDLMPTQSNPRDAQYDVVGSHNTLERGMMQMQIRDGHGQEVFSSTYNASEYAAQASLTSPTSLSMLDSLNIRAIAAFITGRGQNTPLSSTVTFTLKGRQFQIEMQHRGQHGEARNFKIHLNGDTTLVVRTPSTSGGEKQFELLAGNDTLYAGSATVGLTTAGGSVLPDPDDQACLDHFGLIAGEFSLGIAGIIDGVMGLQAFEVMAGLVLLFTSMGELYLWVTDSCLELFADWLRNMWIDNCMNPAFSWTPFCQE